MNDIMETDRGRPPWGVGREKTALKTLNIYKRTEISYNIDKLCKNQIGKKLRIVAQMMDFQLRPSVETVLRSISFNLQWSKD